MDSPKLVTKTDDVTYYKLNNEINRPIDNAIPLHKDKEAVRAYFLEHVNPNTVFFYTLDEKLNYLIEHDYIEKEFLEKYPLDFIKKLMQDTYNKKFRFKSFMAAYKFYTQYALKTNDGKRYLERYEDRIVFNALFLADGDQQLAVDLGGRDDPSTLPTSDAYLFECRQKTPRGIGVVLPDPNDG